MYSVECCCFFGCCRWLTTHCSRCGRRSSTCWPATTPPTSGQLWGACHNATNIRSAMGACHNATNIRSAMGGLPQRHQHQVSYRGHGLQTEHCHRRLLSDNPIWPLEWDDFKTKAVILIQIENSKSFFKLLYI